MPRTSPRVPLIHPLPNFRRAGGASNSPLSFRRAASRFAMARVLRSGGDDASLSWTWAAPCYPCSAPSYGIFDLAEIRQSKSIPFYRSWFFDFGLRNKNERIRIVEFRLRCSPHQFFSPMFGIGVRSQELFQSRLDRKSVV